MKVNYSKVFLAVMFGVLLTSVSVRASQTDDRIQSSAKDSYVFRTYLKDDSINVNSKDGIVTLTGTVKDESNKGLAQETVANLPGVSSVDNQLVINGQQPAENSDGWIGMKVKSSLFFNRNVSAVNTEVDVTNGVVTLKGQADSQAQKDLTGEYAKDIDGVKSVDNQMTIAEKGTTSDQTKDQKKDNKIDDASITAQVKMAFLTHHSTSAFKTGVSTTEGVVTLSGNAVNGAAKDMATKVAGDINGVTNVVNNMTITP